MKLLFMLFNLLFTATALAAPLNLPEPDQLLLKASQGRVELRDVILDITQQISEMRDVKTFDKYFYILPDLQKYSDQFKLEDIYPKAVTTLGLKMVAQGSRWLSVGRDDRSKIEYYFKWMDENVIGTFFFNAEMEVRDEKNLALLTKAAENLEYIIPTIEKIAPLRNDLHQSFRQLLSTIAIKFLRTQLTRPEMEFWISKLSDVNGINQYLDLIQRDIFKINDTNRTLAHELNEKLLLVSGQIGKVLVDPPLWLGNYIGDQQTEIILRMIRMEEKFNANEFQSALTLLNIKQLQGLAGQWVDPQKLPGANYTTHYLDLSKILIDELRKQGLLHDADLLEKAVAQAAAPIYLANLKGEGTYMMQDSKGKKWRFTLAEVKKGLIYAALVDEDQFIHKALFYVGYNLMSGQFTASAREPDLDPSEVPVVQFTIDPNGNIVLIDPYATPDSRELKGKRVESYESYTTITSPSPVNLEGVYEGEFIFPENHRYKMSLTITSINKDSVGRLTGQHGRIYDFNYGTAADRPYIYLTTGRLPRTTWVQIRAYWRDGKLRGRAIVGGRGISPEEFVLDKTK